MERIAFKQIERKSQADSQWEDLVGRFTHSFNSDTPIKKYQLTPKRMAMKLSPLLKVNGIGWLEWFYEDLKKTDHFGKAFNWRTNPKNIK